MATVLVADDEHAICQAFEQFLRRQGHRPIIASKGQEALELIERDPPDAVFLDVQMPGLNGLQILAEIRSRYPDLPVVVMTAYGTVQTAVEAIRLGAFEYLGKPVELPQLRALLDRALRKPLKKVGTESERMLGQTVGAADELVGQSPAMQEIFKLMGLLTTNDLSVMLVGETGVGKELVARGIHAHGTRKDQPFVAVNCAAIPESLLESELFGHEKGAFTGAEDRRIGRFEAAGSGTLFLDEVAELPQALQSKLLRVLQERSFERLGSVQPIPLKARLIAATNRDLDREVERGSFREDLYYRLKLVTLPIPPLRKRKSDIEVLAKHFLRRTNIELNKHVQGLEPAALARLQQHDWPGNVRELQHTIKRAVLMAPGSLLTVHDIDIGPKRATAEGAKSAAPATAHLEAAARAALNELSREKTFGVESPFHKLVTLVETALIDEALQITKNNQVAAADLLGLHRTTMRRKMNMNGESGS